MSLPGSVPWALRELGRRLDDRNASGAIALYVGSTESSVLPARAVEQLDEAQFDIFYRLLDDQVGHQMLQREVALTAVSGSTIAHTLPQRTAEIMSIRDSSMGTDDQPFYAIDGPRTTERGYGIGARGETIQWHNFSVDTSLTYYARVIKEPIHLSYSTVAQAETDAQIFLDLSPTYGLTVRVDDYYTGENVVIESGTLLGSSQQVTGYSQDFATCTLPAAWTLAGTENYSFQSSLPRAMWRAWLADAAAKLAFFHLPSRFGKMEERAEMEYARLVGRVRRSLTGAYGKPRIVVGY